MTEPSSAPRGPAVIHGVAAGAPRWSGLPRVHIKRPTTNSSAYCGVVLRQRWMAKDDGIATCPACIREARNA